MFVLSKSLWKMTFLENLEIVICPAFFLNFTDLDQTCDISSYLRERNYAKKKCKRTKSAIIISVWVFVCVCVCVCMYA